MNSPRGGPSFRGPVSRSRHRSIASCLASYRFRIRHRPVWSRGSRTMSSVRDRGRAEAKYFTVEEANKHAAPIRQGRLRHRPRSRRLNELKQAPHGRPSSPAGRSPPATSTPRSLRRARRDWKPKQEKLLGYIDELDPARRRAQGARRPLRLPEPERDGRPEVYLCWRLGEADRRPLARDRRRLGPAPTPSPARERIPSF